MPPREVPAAGIDPGYLECVRCGDVGGALAATAVHLGCRRCRDTGAPANFRWRIDPQRVTAAFRSHAEHLHRDARARSIARFAPLLPDVSMTSLGEGDTPMIELAAIGAELGLQALSAKVESGNPTWSHKDRLAAMLVAIARANGASTLAVASSGNHGAAVAAYAAKAGMRCVVAALHGVPPAMKELMAALGADVALMDRSEQRYEFLARGVEHDGWFPASNISAPAIGTDARGVAAYKTIAYELFETIGAPDWIVTPTSYGDCLIGIHEGFTDLCRAGLIVRVPRLVAVEVYGALAAALAGHGTGPVPTHPTAAVSIASPYATAQAVTALVESGGRAVSVTEEAIAKARADVARREGILLEASSAASIAAVRLLVADGTIPGSDRVVCMFTSSGLKDLL